MKENVFILTCIRAVEKFLVKIGVSVIVRVDCAVNIVTPSALLCCGGLNSLFLLVMNVVCVPLLYAPSNIGESGVGLRAEDRKGLDCCFGIWLLIFANRDIWFQHEIWHICLLFRLVSPGITHCVLKPFLHWESYAFLSFLKASLFIERWLLISQVAKFRETEPS